MGRGRRAARLAWLCCAAALVLGIGAIALLYLDRANIHSLDDADAVDLVLTFGFSAVGGLVASRQPRNLLGWLMLSNGLASALTAAASQYTLYARLTQPGVPFSLWIPWIGNLSSALAYPAGIAVLTLLLMPNGRFLSPAWRWVAWAGGAITAALATLNLLDPTVFTAYGVPALDPARVPGLTHLDIGPIGPLLFVTGVVVLVIAGASVFVRFRRSAGVERLQLRWVAYGVAVSILINLSTLVVGIFLLPGGIGAFLGILGAVLGYGIVLPASFGVAILRYRLYDLDLLANRTVVYGLVTVILALAFGAADLVGQRLLETLVGQHSDLLSGALGVAAALTFGPVRQRIRPVVDRFLPARGRLTMLFTDIVGSTQTIVEVGDERWREILDGYRSTVRTSLSRFRGREEDTAGDAFFATFDHPGAAMACAREIRGAVKGLGLTLRTGLHVGQVEMRGEKVSGLTVHAAARIMAEAGGDQILVSEDLAEALRDGMPGALPDGIPFVDAGRHTLKGVPGEWQLFALAPAD